MADALRRWRGRALTNAQLLKLERFLGYGHLTAPVWFIGMEEGGGGPENIVRRLDFGQVEDCARAHRKLGLTKYHDHPNQHGGRPRIQPTWGRMSSFMLALRGTESPTPDAVRRYQAEQLGREHGETMLVELMPIPKASSKMSKWPYEGLLPQYGPGGAEYHARVKPARVKLLRESIAVHRPRLVVCYGKAFWGEFEALFPQLEFFCEPADGTRPLYRLARGSGQFVLLTHHLVAKTMNGQVAPLGARCREWLQAPD